jgi:hypothetical protein
VKFHSAVEGVNAKSEEDESLWTKLTLKTEVLRFFRNIGNIPEK